ncbi:hypothetical protein [Corynebacterium choanae]|uniref:Beta-lactamase enzyme family protein n=1 Tax=Corynebacterium choanae TaxID=1862358 RepID=A0A3G6JEY4_9CORY|nr:hypothetical protein [Corynebacterium choanae]AZA14694.1 hypothetical protein CCHOA_11615 [Corynebacterium choanae]
MAVAVAVGSISAFPTPAEALTITQAPPARTQVSVIDTSTGVMTNSLGDLSGASLSLAKLYLGYAVLAAGDPADAPAVAQMIRTSDDAIADRLDRKYPGAIVWTIRRYQLRHTTAGATWGWGNTSVNDVARFVAAIQHDPIARPLIDAMAQATPIAADGYPQDYGTATIPGTWATKFGWDDDGRINASVSIGPDFVVAARTAGSKEQLTNDLASLGALPGNAHTLPGHQRPRTRTVTPQAQQTAQAPAFGSAQAYAPFERVDPTVVQARLHCLPPGSSHIPAAAINIGLLVNLLPQCTPTPQQAPAQVAPPAAYPPITDADRVFIRTDLPGSLRLAPPEQRPWALHQQGLPVPPGPRSF